MERWFSPRFRREHPDELAGWRNMFLRTDVEGYCGSCATLRDSDLSNDVSRISTSTLVVVGEADGSTPIETVRKCADAIPGARFQVIADAGHLPCVEQPNKLAAMIISFLRESGHG
jgi:pimeloyl-ACP methyl ester carboxylesterase